MDSRRNLCLLPSNAPIQVEHNSIPRGILQNTSGNVQSNILENSEAAPHAPLPAQPKDIRAEYPPQSIISSSCEAEIGSTSESTCTRAPLITASSYAQTNRSRLEQRRGLRDRIVDNRLPILTRSELRSPAYLKYRSRQRQNLGKDGKPVWPEFLEEAFQRGTQPHLSSFHVPRLMKVQHCGNIDPLDAERE